MAVKLSPWKLPRRIPNWVSLNAHLSSISCAINSQPTQEADQSQLNSTEFEAKIQFLRNKLHPDSLVSVLDSTPDLKSSVKLFKWASLQKTFHHTADTYRMMILKLGMSGNVEEMEGFVNEMRGNVQEAAKVFCYMSCKGCGLQSTSFSILIEKICASGEVNRAIRLLSLANYTGTASLGPTYNSVFRGLSKLDQENYLLVILSQMIVVGCAFDLETYCILIQCMSALNRIGDCISLLNLMLSEDLMPDSETLASLLSCSAKYSQMHLICTSIDKLVSKSEILDATMYNIIINSLWREGYRSEASHFLDLMLENDWIPDASTHALLIGSIARNEMVSRKSVDESFGIQDNVSCILAEGLGKT